MPQAIGAALISGFNAIAGTSIAGTGTILGVSTAQLVGTIALTTASTIANQALAPSPELSSQKVNVRNTVQPRRRLYGQGRVAGTVALVKRSLVTGDGILYLVVLLNSGEIDSILEHWVGDQITRLDPSPGAVTGVIGGVIYPAVWLDGQRVTIQTALGTTTQTANPLLLAAFPAYWTTAHTLTGIAYSVLKMNGVALTDFGEVYSGIPNYSAVIRGAKVYDPRDIAQDINDSTTWLWTENAALIIMDYLWHADGMRLPRALIETALADWIVAADYCDVQIPLIGGGTEARYRLSGAYDFTDPPKATLAKMLAPIDGRVRLREDGSIVLDVGMFETPTAAETFGDADIISYVDFRRAAPKSELINEVRATYTSRGHNYQQQEADPLKDQTSIDLDGLQSTMLNLDWCPSHSQARRRMKVESYRLNPEWQGTIITNARGLNLLGKRYGQFAITDLGIDESFFIRAADIDLLSGRCTFQVSSFPSTAYDWVATEEGISPEHISPGLHGVIVPTGATSVTIVADGGGGGGSDRAGGGGARSTKTIAVSAGDWGSVIQFRVGAGGIGDAYLANNNATDGQDSTVTGTLLSGVINMVGGGGKQGTNSGGAGGVASGGTTNTNGHAGVGVDGGYGGSGAPENEYPGGGGDSQTDGANGAVIFTWV